MLEPAAWPEQLNGALWQAWIGLELEATGKPGARRDLRQVRAEVLGDKRGHEQLHRRTAFQSGQHLADPFHEGARVAGGGAGRPGDRRGKLDRPPHRGRVLLRLPATGLGQHVGHPLQRPGQTRRGIGSTGSLWRSWRPRRLIAAAMRAISPSSNASGGAGGRVAVVPCIATRG